MIDGAYTQKISQDASDRDEYIGIAKPGTAATAALWQIRKITYTGTNRISDVQWAGGSDQFNQVWNDRAAAVYS